jgi:hypothetical protein
VFDGRYKHSYLYPQHIRFPGSSLCFLQIMLHTKTIRSQLEPESHVSFIRVLAASSSLAERADNSTYGWATTLITSAMEYRGRLRSARCTEYHSSKHLPLVHRTGGVRHKSRYRALTFSFLSLLTCTCCSRWARYLSFAGWISLRHCLCSSI